MSVKKIPMPKIEGAFMEFRRASGSDTGRIMEIVRQAQDYFRIHSIDQWQNDYPNNKVICADIQNKSGYVILTDDKIVAYAVLSFDKEDAYEALYCGEWQRTEDYAVIHRMAVDNAFKGRGLASVILKKFEEICLAKGIRYIRTDTHEENIPMQDFLRKAGFKYCGVVFLTDGSKRVAFDKTI